MFESKTHKFGTINKSNIILKKNRIGKPKIIPSYIPNNLLHTFGLYTDEIKGRYQGQY
jgi:hypothetical protein